MSEEACNIEEMEGKRFPFIQRYPPNLNFLNAIPTQAQKGFKNIHIVFNCIDVCEQYIAVGTNIGVAYLYDRKKDKLHKLRSTDYTDAVSCVKLLVSLECMVAIGTTSGSVFAFKVPFKEQEEIEKFKVEGLHHNTITALEWVKNGIKFFSGDGDGVVVCTEIDHLEHQSLSAVILEENNEIVQMSYFNQKLLVSTLQRCLIYDSKEKNLYQVGQKDRKCLGKFGGTFYLGPSDERLYSSRPGQRIWKSDVNGVISETILLKAAFTALSQSSSRNGFQEFQFGLLKLYCSEFLLTWSNNKVVLVDPILGTVKCIGHFPDIVEVCACHDEIFVLQGLRNVVRLATYSEDKEDFLIKDEPELFVPLEKFTVVENEEKKNVKPDAIDPPNVFDWIKRKFSEVAILDDQEDLDPVRPERSKTVASDLPDVVTLDVNYPQVEISSESPVQVFGQITRTGSSDEIVYKPKPPKKKKKKKDKKKVQFDSETPAEVHDRSNMHEDRLRLPDEGQDPENLDSTSESITTDCIDSTNSLKASDIDDRVETNHDIPVDNISICSITCSIKDDSSSDNIESSLLETTAESSVSDSVVDDLQIKPDGSTETVNYDEIDSTVKYDSLFDIEGNVLANSIKDKDEQVVLSEDSPDREHIDNLTSDVPKYGIECIQHKAPGTVISLCASNLHMFCVDYQNCLYVSEFHKYSFHWMKLDQPAEQVAVSPSEDIVWALYKGTAYAAKRCNVNVPLKGVEWVPVARSVSYIAVSDTCSWYISWDGHLSTCQNLSVAQPYNYPQKVRHPPNLTQIACKDDIIWVLTAEGKLCRGVCGTKVSFEVSKWKEIVLPSRLPVSSLCFAGHGVAYVMDQNDTLWFCVDVSSSNRRGFKSIWQVESGTYVYESAYNPALKAIGKVINTELFTSLIHGQSQKLITSSTKGIWWCKSMDSMFHSCQKFVIGHTWEPVVPKGTVSTTKWDIVSAEDYLNFRDIFWAYSSSKELMCSSLKKSNCIVVDLPGFITVQCMHSTVNSLWVLSTQGEIYIRREISERSPQGIRWQKLDTSQLCDVSLTHMSCSSEIVWACDSKGSVLARIGTLHPPTGTALTQAWIPVDARIDMHPVLTQKSIAGKAFNVPHRQRSEKMRFSKVYVGPKSYMVWAIDDKGLVYVRNNITSSLMVGDSWLIVPGPRAKQLCISSTGVWLVKYSGKIFRRFGITKSNITGDYWKQIPGRVSFLSVTQGDDLWGIHDNSLCRHFSHTLEYEVQEEKKEEEEDTAEISDDDWEEI